MRAKVPPTLGDEKTNPFSKTTTDTIQTQPVHNVPKTQKSITDFFKTSTVRRLEPMIQKSTSLPNHTKTATFWTKQVTSKTEDQTKNTT